MESKFTGLSTFDPFPDGNASQVDTKARFGSKLLPAIFDSTWANIFSSSCYGFANSTAPLPAHSGWVLVVYKFSIGNSSDIRGNSVASVLQTTILSNIRCIIDIHTKISYAKILIVGLDFMNLMTTGKEHMFETLGFCVCLI